MLDCAQTLKPQANINLFKRTDTGRIERYAPYRTANFEILLKCYLFFFLECIPIFIFLFFFIYFYQLEANYFTILQWVLSYIDMNQPWIYMYSPSQSPLPSPSLPDPSGSSQGTRPELSATSSSKLINIPSVFRMNQKDVCSCPQENHKDVSILEIIFLFLIIVSILVCVFLEMIRSLMLEMYLFLTPS